MRKIVPFWQIESWAPNSSTYIEEYSKKNSHFLHTSTGWKQKILAGNRNIYYSSGHESKSKSMRRRQDFCEAHEIS